MARATKAEVVAEGAVDQLGEAFAGPLTRRRGMFHTCPRPASQRGAGGRVAGVVLENGERVSAPLVISNADARQTVEELVGSEHSPARFRRQLEKATPSACVVYAATSLDLAGAELGNETFLCAGPDHEVPLESGRRGEASWLSGG